MLNFYEFIDQSALFRQFRIDDLLFTAYDCVIEESPLDYWTQKNYFAYGVRGQIRWKTMSHEYIISPGDTVFVKKGAHRAFKMQDGDFCALLIFIPDEFIRSVIKAHHPQWHGNTEARETDSIIPVEPDDVLQTYFQSVLNYFAQAIPPSKSLLKVKFEELILTLIDRKDNAELQGYFHDIYYHQKRSLTQIMEANFLYDLTLDEFATMSGRSLATFKRDFTQAYQTTPGRWLKARRLDFAKFLLETTDMNVGEVMLESGFSNPSHFAKVFKAKFHTPPLTYKKQASSSSQIL